MKIIYANFNAECEWKGPNDIYIIPNITNTFSDMEELMSVMCEGDIIVSTVPFSKELSKLLKNYGIKYTNITEDEIEKYIYKNSINVNEFNSFGVTSKSISLAERLNVKYEYPNIEKVKFVNSKEFSVEISRKLGLNNSSYIAHDYSDFCTITRNMLAEYGAIMIKEPFGVSGRGNYLCSNPKQLERIISKVYRQTRKSDIKFCLIVEPFFKIVKNFSTQMQIKATGEIKIYSLQEIINDRFSYNGSVTPSEELLQTINCSNYYSDIIKVAEKVYEYGYYGDICIDSALTINGIIPVIEINARKSMSYLKHLFDVRFMSEKNNKSFFSALISIKTPISKFSFQNLIKKLEDSGVLLSNYNGYGGIPVTDGCKDYVINQSGNIVIYFYVIEKSIESLCERMNQVKEILNAEEL